LAPTGNETVLYSFKSGTDGSFPATAGVILDSAGNIYGTTLEGGISGCSNSLTCGVVFKLDPSGNETVLYTFTGGADGGQPWAGVTQDSEGNLYGTTAAGGASGYGVVFKVDTTGHETVLHSFTGGADGGAPYAGVILDSGGNLYGTTTSGGSSNEGVVFRLDPSGNETVLYAFTGKGDGGTPIAGLVLDSEYNLYGTTYWDGAASVWGVVYKISGANFTPQAITFGALPNQPYGTPPFSVSATASSGLPVSFNSQNTRVCTVSGATVTLLVGGRCTIQATQAGDATYSAAPPVNQSFQVTPASQTITFGPLSNQPYGTAPFKVSAHASSGLPVSFNSQTARVCTVSGITLMLLTVGTCTVQATQAGNADYAAATPVNQSFQVTQWSQTITFGPLQNQPYGSPPFTVTATASSGLTVHFNSQTLPVCRISGTTVTLVAGGTCTIQATQAGNADYTAATPVNRSFQVTPLSQTIAFPPLSNQTYGTPPFTVSATASSGLRVSFNSQTTAVCKVAGTTVRLVTVGTCTIQATQPGNADYTAAPPVDQSFQVAQGNQTITFPPLPNQTLGSPPFTVSATANSGLTVRFNSQTKPVCKVSGTTVTLVAVGTCTIQATQPGNANYAAAAPVDQSFQVTSQ
jgi:uncharacterized repeat protein (TIGR03803 family)